MNGVQALCVNWFLATTIRRWWCHSRWADADAEIDFYLLERQANVVQCIIKPYATFTIDQKLDWEGENLFL